MSFIIDVDTESFEQAVIARSHELPVLVDFWAAWCGPCRILGPVLEKLAQEFAGAILLAKVDTEASPELARRYGIRGIPDVKLFSRGDIVDGFVGAQPERAVRQFLEKHLPSELDLRVREAEKLVAEGDVDGATQILDEVVAERRNHAVARLMLARLALSAGDDAALQAHASAILPGPEADEAAALVELSALAQRARAQGTLEEVEAALRARPEDANLSYAAGAHLAASGRFPEALERLVSTLALRGAPREDVRRAMVALFAVLGPKHPLAQEYRRRLQVLL